MTVLSTGGMQLVKTGKREHKCGNDLKVPVIIFLRDLVIYHHANVALNKIFNHHA